jgi:DNA-binding NtrC family response regulator
MPDECPGVDPVAERPAAGDVVGTSRAMREVFSFVSKVAPWRDPILILGESGVGKELLARAIHMHSPWHDEPFVPVDCASLTPALIESELFGHTRGAFTGAVESRQGLLASARRGTVFLDEIGELLLELQSRLLRALQEHEVRPVGSEARRHLESRIVASTNQDLKGAVARGVFRKDLYFRLNVLTVELPPLRARKSDIPALVRHFLARHGAESRGFGGVSDGAMSRLLAYDWPGNVRELENCVRRALVLGSGPEIQAKDLPSSVLYAVGDSPSLRTGVVSLRELERRAILRALDSARGDRLQAAMLLGISKTTIYRKLKQYEAEDGSPQPPPVRH